MTVNQAPAAASRIARSVEPLLRCVCSFLLILIVPATALSQSRVLEHYGPRTAEGRLLGFYSAALSASALGAALTNGAGPAAIALGFELAYIPHLDRNQRTAGFDKPEASNLSPVLPRPILGFGLPGGFAAEVSWLPPVEVMDASANLFHAALSRPMNVGGVGVTPRISFLTGRVKGAITCSDELAAGSLSDQFYFADVCHARESEDHFDPRHLSVDVTFRNTMRLLAGEPYLTVGARREEARFDIGVIAIDGSRDLDHPVLGMETTKVWTALGLQWRTGERSVAGAEAFYSQGSILTVRAIAGWRLR